MMKWQAVLTKLIADLYDELICIGKSFSSIKSNSCINSSLIKGFNYADSERFELKQGLHFN